MRDREAATTRGCHLEYTGSEEGGGGGEGVAQGSLELKSKIHGSRAGIKTDFSRITDHSASYI